MTWVLRGLCAPGLGFFPSHFPCGSLLVRSPGVCGFAPVLVLGRLPSPGQCWPFLGGTTAPKESPVCSSRPGSTGVYYEGPWVGACAVFSLCLPCWVLPLSLPALSPPLGEREGGLPAAGGCGPRLLRKLPGVFAQAGRATFHFADMLAGRRRPQPMGCDQRRHPSPQRKSLFSP